MISASLTVRRIGLWGVAAVLSVSAAAQSVEVLRTPGEVEIVAPKRTLIAAAPLWQLDSITLLGSGAVSTADALRRLPGINLRDYGGAGGLKTVSVRGLGSPHTVVLYDGLPVGDAQNGQIDFGRFTLSRIKTLSLSVGENPELLVPVRTLGAATVSLLPTASSRQIGWRMGAFGLLNPSVSWAEQWGKTTISASGDFLHGDNDYPFLLKNGRTATRERRSHSRMQTWNGELAGRYLDGGNELSGRAAYRANHRHLPGPVTLYTQLGTEFSDEQQLFAQCAYRHRSERVSWMAAAKHAWQESRYVNRDRQYPGGEFRQQYWQRETYLTLGVQRDFGKTWQAAYATDYTHAGLNSDLSVDRRVHRHSWQQGLSARYRHSRWDITGRLLLHLHRNRLEKGAPHPLFFPGTSAPPAPDVRRLTPSLSAACSLIRRQHSLLRLRTFYKEIFRMPTFVENYYFNYGNRLLRPELTRQLGIGTTFRLLPQQTLLTDFDITLDAYSNRVSDRITAIPLNPVVWQTVNLDRVRALGFDLTAHGRFRFSAQQQLVVRGHYSLQNVTDRSHPEGATYGLQLAYTPRHTASLSLAWENPWLPIVVSTSGASERWATHQHAFSTRLPPYWETNLSLSKSLRFLRRRADLRLDITNVFDRQYEILRRYPMPGRAWQYVLIYHF